MASLIRAKIDAKNKGKAYVQDKYGMSFYNKYRSQIERSTGTALGRSTAYGGQSIKNAPPKPSGHYTYNGVRLGFQDGGEAPTETGGVPFGQSLQLNLENDSELAQGSQTEWAQPTSISHLITSLLRESQTAPQNYWDQFATNNGGTVQLNQQPSSSFGYSTPQFTPNTGKVQMIGQTPMGAFGTNQVMQEEAPTTTTGTGTNSPTPVGNIDIKPGSELMPTGGSGLSPDSQVYNPWAFGGGGNANAYGPSNQYMAGAQMEAMELANQYFAPQRMELAYELGDMETDMRRLAVNLGRQVDDPTLQAKLYKEAMRAVRTMDVQQNTLALQMADQRRKEELQNFQYYDALAQQEFQLNWANQQFYDDLGLRSAYFDLQNSIGMAQPYATSTTNTGTGGAAAPQSQVDLSGIYKNMMTYNPYNQGGNLLR